MEVKEARISTKNEEAKFEEEIKTDTLSLIFSFFFFLMFSSFIISGLSLDKDDSFVLNKSAILPSALVMPAGQKFPEKITR